jgi:hypothetical protein
MPLNASSNNDLISLCAMPFIWNRTNSRQKGVALSRIVEMYRRILQGAAPRNDKNFIKHRNRNQKNTAHRIWPQTYSIKKGIPTGVCF